MVGRCAVAQAVGPARILGHVASDAAGLLARRVRRVVQAVRRSSTRDVEIDDARLDDCDSVL